MTVIRKTLSDGNIAEFDSTQDSPEAIDRYVKDYEARASTQKGVPTGAEGGPATIEGDTTPYDDWGTTIDKNVKTGVRAFGSGWAKTGDLLATTGRSALDTAKAYAAPFLSEEPKYSKGGFSTSVSDAYNRNVIPIPKGYEKVHDVEEVVLPALVGNVGGSVLRLPAQLAGRKATQSALGTVLKELAVKPAARTATDIGLGEVGGRVGGGVGELVGQKDLGTLLGSALVSGGAGSGTKYVANKLLTGPKSKQVLQAIDDINKFLPPDKQIQPTLGLTGNKGTGLLEDVTGRGTLAGRPAVQARRNQYTGIEEAKREAANRVRGGPATGPITDLTVGRENVFMGQKAQKAIKKEISDIEEKLKADVGGSTPVTTDNLIARMEAIVDDPSDQIDAEIRDHARTIIKKYARNLKVTPPVTGIGPPQVDPPTFGKVQGFRSRLGQTVHKGQPLDVGTRKQAYGATTEDLRETAEAQGITDFPTRQAKTERLSRLEESVQPTAEAPTAKQAHTSVFGGPAKSDVEQFTPYTEFTPDLLKPIIGNELERRIRGGQAGREVNPEAMNMDDILKNWRDMDEEFKIAYSGGDPQTRKLLDDIATTAEAETVRAGKRTVPGKTGSTMGATMEIMRPAMYGGIIGGGGGYGVDSMMGSLAGALSGAVVTPALAYGATRGIGGLLTDPRIARGVVNPTYSKLGAAQHALGGVASQAAIQEQEQGLDAEVVAREQARRDEEEAMRKRLISGG